MKNKRGELTWDTMIPYVIAIGVLVFIIFLYIVLHTKGINALTFIKNLFRFG